MYLVRLIDGRPANIRDGRGLKAPVRLVTQDRFVLFDHLPSCCTEQGGPGIEVRTVSNKAEAQRMQTAADLEIEAARKSREAYRAKVREKIEGITRRAAEEAKVAPPVAKVHTGEPAKLAHNSTGQRRG